MGLLNGMRTIGEINSLLRDLENQVTILKGQYNRKVSKDELNNSINVLRSIHEQLIVKFASSAAARGATYSVFGDRMQMDGILSYSKNIIYSFYALVNGQ